MFKYKRLRDLREDNDLTQNDIAKYLGMFAQQYARYESGEREIPVHHLISLSKFYNVTIDYLVSKVEQ